MGHCLAVRVSMCAGAQQRKKNEDGSIALVANNKSRENVQRTIGTYMDHIDYENKLDHCKLATRVSAE